MPALAADRTAKTIDSEGALVARGCVATWYPARPQGSFQADHALLHAALFLCVPLAFLQACLLLLPGEICELFERVAWRLEFISKQSYRQETKRF